MSFSQMLLVGSSQRTISEDSSPATSGADESNFAFLEHPAILIFEVGLNIFGKSKAKLYDKFNIKDW